MIKLVVEDYCHTCTEFKAEVNLPEVYYDTFDGSQQVVGDTIICCKHAAKCNRIKQYLEATTKKERL